MSAEASPQPYVGLRPFQTADAAWFFGREHESTALARKIRGNRFTAVVGASGSGKSSLVLAGVLPQLVGDGWQSLEAKPGAAPIAQLAAALAAAAAGGEDHLGQARRFRFDASLRGSAFGLADVVASMSPNARPIVLVIDQFEELFRYGEGMTGSQRAAMREEGRAFVELLLTATRHEGSLHVVLTMRSDYFGNCAAYQGLAEAVSASLYLVPVPNRDQLETAIRNPVAKAGATIDDGLVQRLLVEVEEEADRLPLLQHCLMRLWQQPVVEAQGGDGASEPTACPVTRRALDLSAYRSLRESLSAHADEILAELERQHPTYPRVAEFLFRALTEIDNQGRPVRRPRTMAELTLEIGADLAVLQRVIGPFRRHDATFLAPYGDKPLVVDDVVDISHEAFIRCWKRINDPTLDEKTGRPKGWLQREEKDGRTWRSLLSNAEAGTPLSLPSIEWHRRWLGTLPGSGWAQRHGGNPEAVERLLQLENDAVSEWLAFLAGQLRKDREYKEYVRHAGYLVVEDVDRYNAKVNLCRDILVGGYGATGFWKHITLHWFMSSDVYRYLEEVWFRDVIKLEAHSIWESKGAVLDRPPELIKEDYFDAYEKYRWIFLDQEIKRGTDEFLTVKDYLSTVYMDDTGKRHALIARKARELSVYATKRQDDKINWMQAAKFVEEFYNNIIPAVMELDRVALHAVREAVWRSESKDSRLSIMNCLEAGICMYFVRGFESATEDWEPLSNKEVSG